MKMSPNTKPVTTWDLALLRVKRFLRFLPLLIVVLAVLNLCGMLNLPNKVETATVTATQAPQEHVSGYLVTAKETAMASPTATPTAINTTPVPAATEEEVAAEPVATEEPVIETSEWDQEFDKTLPLANWYSVTEGESKSPINRLVGTECVRIQAEWGVYTPIKSGYQKYIQCESPTLILTVENMPTWLALVPRGSIEKPSVTRSIVDGFAVEGVEVDRATMKVGRDVKITRVCGLNKVENDVTYYRVVVGYDKALSSQENQETGQCVTVVDKDDNVKMVTLRFIGQLADTLEGGTNAYKVTLPAGYEGNLLGKLPMERK